MSQHETDLGLWSSHTQFIWSGTTSDLAKEISYFKLNLFYNASMWLNSHSWVAILTNEGGHVWP